ncbi:MAG: hypothetical protein HY879_10720 [Deltaproteobacteria bacterium]|nr:hypothetical protein [Deltaproteobacteria bacterium]
MAAVLMLYSWACSLRLGHLIEGKDFLIFISQAKELPFLKSPKVLYSLQSFLNPWLRW